MGWGGIGTDASRREINASFGLLESEGAQKRLAGFWCRPHARVMCTTHYTYDFSGQSNHVRHNLGRPTETSVQHLQCCHTATQAKSQSTLPLVGLSGTYDQEAFCGQTMCVKQPVFASHSQYIFPRHS
jgi:hypothetical protein